MPGKRGRRGWGYLRKLPSGKFQASYIGPDLMRHTAPNTYTAKMDGEGWLAAERRLIELGTWVAPAERVAETKAKAMTLAEYAQTWVDQRTLKPRSRIGYQASLDRHILPMLGRVPLRNLSADTVRTWFAGLGTDHPTRNAHAYQLLHAILKTALSDGLLTANPANIVGVMNPKTKRQAVIPTVAEVDSLAEAVPAKLRTLVLVLAWCGPRWGEAIELRRKDITDGCKAIRIGRAVTHRRDGEGYCRIDSTKSGVSRVVIVPPHVRDDLRRHLDEFVGPEPDALLFAAAQSCHLHERTFRKWWREAQEAVGCREAVTIHDLRHFAGTMAAQVGNLRETQDRLGHSTVKASLIYQQAVDGGNERVAEKLSELAKAKRQ